MLPAKTGRRVQRESRPPKQEAPWAEDHAWIELPKRTGRSCRKASRAATSRRRGGDMAFHRHFFRTSDERPGRTIFPEPHKSPGAKAPPFAGAKDGAPGPAPTCPVGALIRSRGFFSTENIRHIGVPPTCRCASQADC